MSEGYTSLQIASPVLIPFSSLVPLLVLDLGIILKWMRKAAKQAGVSFSLSSFHFSFLFSIPFVFTFFYVSNFPLCSKLNTGSVKAPPRGAEREAGHQDSVVTSHPCRAQTRMLSPNKQRDTLKLKEVTTEPSCPGFAIAYFFKIFNYLKKSTI